MAFTYSNLPSEPPEQAKEIVRRYVNSQIAGNTGNVRFEVRLISFTAIIDEWTATVLTDVDFTHYVVTSDTDSDRIHLNVYPHRESVVFEV